jgi:hypothetical protein
MPHFHFDVCESGVLSPDEEGLDLPSADAARLEAARAAAEIIRDRAAWDAEPADVSMIIREGSAQRLLCTLTVALHRCDGC